MHFIFTSPFGAFGIESFTKRNAEALARAVNPQAKYLGPVHPARFPAILAAQPKTVAEFRAVRGAAA